MLTLVTLVNDHGMFARCRASAALPHEWPWIVVEPNPSGWNAARGLNHGLDRATTPWVVFCHQDILFPRNWAVDLLRVLERLPSRVAVAGPVGTTDKGRYRGHILDPKGHKYWGPLPDRALILDEVVLALRRECGLRFTEEIPGFHCYGADICLQARAKGLDVMAIDAPIHHLSSGSLNRDFDEAAAWLLRRWGPLHRFILSTPSALIEDSGRAGSLRRLLMRVRRRLDRSRGARSRPPDPVRLEE